MMAVNSERISGLEKIYQTVRNKTMELVRPISRDDFMVQSIPQASPPKWHLAHTTWFFDRFILRNYLKNWKTPDTNYDFLFNSYYETLGPYMEKISRKSLSRPSLEEVYEYREAVDEAIAMAFNENQRDDNFLKLVELGINHEEQHQELLLMDIKINYYNSPYRPAYTKRKGISEASEMKFIRMDGGVKEIGWGEEGFSFDNERPRHRVYLSPFRISSRPVSNAEYVRFIEDGGYERPELWLSDGWAFIKQKSQKLPLYWEKEGDQYLIFKLSGVENLNESEPAVHISYYEADAFARWSGMRLPIEAEWELFATSSRQITKGNFMEENSLHPACIHKDGQPQISGASWEWTSSPYVPYPGYRPYDGSLGEYNGKFMNNQYVLRGGSAVTPERHYRNTYRNFYHPDSSWQFSGIRLAGDIS
ncbi:MAG: ergothioneine biosynthesis protein EgtB [Candidatus Thermoplasmatota archaeon]|jgi:ergothioneine biosynthesis protein EgtB|nr:ergothioneine biosynthesis protein EgtB [Candidatus Thermoplasmatota archaeon]